MAPPHVNKPLSLSLSLSLLLTARQNWEICDLKRLISRQENKYWESYLTFLTEVASFPMKKRIQGLTFIGLDLHHAIKTLASCHTEIRERERVIYSSRTGVYHFVVWHSHRENGGANAIWWPRIDSRYVVQNNNQHEASGQQPGCSPYQELSRL